MAAGHRRPGRGGRAIRRLQADWEALLHLAEGRRKGHRRSAIRLRVRIDILTSSCSWVEIRRKPGTDTELPAQFAGNWLSVPGFAPRIRSPFIGSPIRLSTRGAAPEQPPVLIALK